MNVDDDKSACETESQKVNTLHQNCFASCATSRCNKCGSRQDKRRARNAVASLKKCLLKYVDELGVVVNADAEKGTAVAVAVGDAEAKGLMTNLQLPPNNNPMCAKINEGSCKVTYLMRFLRVLPALPNKPTHPTP